MMYVYVFFFSISFECSIQQEILFKMDTIVITKLCKYMKYNKFDYYDITIKGQLTFIMHTF